MNKLNVEYMNIDILIPYINNPRKNLDLKMQKPLNFLVDRNL
jgi:hypothetical protein